LQRYAVFALLKADSLTLSFTCDGWLPVTGNVGLLDDIERFRHVLQMCMLRVFQGLRTAISTQASDQSDGSDDADLGGE
jgi:hypothetical protein